MLIDIRPGRAAASQSRKPRTANDIEMEAILADSRTESADAAAAALSAARPVLTAAQRSRAAYLQSWSAFDLGWRLLPDPDPRSRLPSGATRYFFFNSWTGRTIWRVPADGSGGPRMAERTLESQASDKAIPGDIQAIDWCVQWMRNELGIDLILWEEAASSRSSRSHNASPSRGRHACASIQPLLSDFGSGIRALRPCLWSLLFYAHLLRSEFALYPRSYLRNCAGLRTIILAEHLSLGSQARMAIPLVVSGVLLLDVQMEDATYTVNVLHHELWHMIDVSLIWKAENAERSRAAPQQQQTAAKQQNGGSKQQQLQRGTTSEFDDDSSWSSDENSSSASAAAFDFSTPLLPADRDSPLPLHARLHAGRLHSAHDAGWARLNSPAFGGYGRGGDVHRGKELFLSSSSSVAVTGKGGNSSSHAASAGFLNGYSQSAIEEDKAEVYAALMRAPASLLDAPSSATTADPSSSILRAKAHELKRRMEWSCGEIDEGFWRRLREHNPRLSPLQQQQHQQPSLPPSRAATLAGPGDGSHSPGGSPPPSPSAPLTSPPPASVSVAPAAHADNDWAELRTHEGHLYYFNRATQTTSWVRPQWTHHAAGKRAMNQSPNAGLSSGAGLASARLVE